MGKIAICFPGHRGGSLQHDHVGIGTLFAATIFSELHAIALHAAFVLNHPILGREDADDSRAISKGSRGIRSVTGPSSQN